MIIPMTMNKSNPFDCHMVMINHLLRSKRGDNRLVIFYENKCEILLLSFIFGKCKKNGATPRDEIDKSEFFRLI